MSRLPGWDEIDRIEAEELAEVNREVLTAFPKHGVVPITPSMMDEAFRKAAERSQLTVENRVVFERLAATDTRSSATQTYYASKAAAVSSSKTTVAQVTVKVKDQLTDKQMEYLASYAPEYQLEFLGSKLHDHSMANIMRKLDHKLIYSRLPKLPTLNDIGGDPMFYIDEGLDNVHVCGGACDKKDDSRTVYRSFRAKRVANDASRDVVSRRLARRFLRNDETFVCGKKGQMCLEQANVLLAIHVYDVPITEWPVMMARKGAYAVEGCMLFSDAIIDQTEGDMMFAQARFRVDSKTDKFTMGFVDSPGEWYTHSWKAYSMYGTDHVFQCSKSNDYYSYKIIEKRQDTIFFRILKGNGLQPYSVIHARRSPHIDIVKVDGFQLATHETTLVPLKRKDWFFPKKLWFEMVSQASEDFERGVLEFTAMYRYYRTVSVRQTINAVLVVGGDPVSPDELVPLVVHSCLAAALHSTMGQRETRGLTDLAMANRLPIGRRVLKKFRDSVMLLAKTPLLLATSPFVALMSCIDKLTADTLSEFLVTWEPMVEIIRVPVHKLATLDRDGILGRSNVDAADENLTVFARAGTNYDHVNALLRNKILRERFLSTPGVKPLDAMLDTVDPSDRLDGDTPSLRSGSTQPPGYTSRVDADSVREGVSTRDESRTQRRLAAIREHIHELEVSMRATESSCGASFRHLFAGGQVVPTKKLLETSDEYHKCPDVWRVVKGVLVSSVRGLLREDFSHSAVYSPDLLHHGSSIRSVDKRVFVNPESGTKEVDYVLTGPIFTGNVLVNTTLSVYNGHDMLETLKLALSVPHDYHVKVVQAPPGCGKTYTIKGLMKTDGSDCFSCPVRESADATRKEFGADNPQFTEIKRYMRTLDSYLCNYNREPGLKELTVRRLLADEVYMAHSGKWYAMAGLLGVDTLWGYGDKKQIPHIARVECPSQHVRIDADAEEFMWVNYRNPAAAVAGWGHVYNNGLRTVSQEVGYMEEVKSTAGRKIVPGTVMMCMYQATKVELRKIYKQYLHQIKIITAHESEGKTFDHVWLHKTDPRIRTDNSSLYDSESHCVVAASRHRKGFLYVNYGSKDLISSWIVNSKNPVKVFTVKQLDTAGQIN